MNNPSSDLVHFAESIASLHTLRQVCGVIFIAALALTVLGVVLARFARLNRTATVSVALAIVTLGAGVTLGAYGHFRSTPGLSASVNECIVEKASLPVFAGELTSRVSAGRACLIEDWSFNGGTCDHSYYEDEVWDAVLAGDVEELADQDYLECPEEQTPHEER